MCSNGCQQAASRTSRRSGAVVMAAQRGGIGARPSGDRSIGVRNRRSTPWVESGKGASMPRIRLHVGFALKAVETRQACAAYEYLMAAILTANALPKPVRLALRDHIREHTKRRKGRQWDLMRAYVTFLEEPLETVRMREWQELHGLRVVPPLAPFI